MSPAFPLTMPVAAPRQFVGLTINKRGDRYNVFAYVTKIGKLWLLTLRVNEITADQMILGGGGNDDELRSWAEIQSP